jgi:hypothetical protein
LSKKVTKLQKDYNTLKNLALTCVFYKADSVDQFGNPPGNEGYVYSNPDNSLELQTAMDFSTPSSTSTWLLTTSADCANAINSAKKKVASFRVHVK